MSQIKLRNKALARLAAFCLGTSALTVPALAAVFSVGGGTITTTQADAASDFTGGGGPFELQANTTGNNDTIVISNVTINSPGSRTLDVGGNIPSSGSYSVTMHGSTLTGGAGGWFQSVGGLINLDTTGGAANTMSGDLALTVSSGSGTGSVAVNLGADNITSTFEAVQVIGANAAMSLDMAGTTVASTGTYGIVAQNGVGNITIGGLNGGLTGSITATNGYGIYTSSSGNISVTIAPSGSITALNGIYTGSSMSRIDNFGTLTATNNAITTGFGPLTAILEAGSTTSGKLLGGSGNDNFSILAGADIANATFDGGAGTNFLNLTGASAGNLDLSKVSNVQNLQKTQVGTWTILGTGTLPAIAVDGGTLKSGSTTALSSGTSLTMNGGTFDLNGNDISIGPLLGTGGTIALGANALSVTMAGIDGAFSGVITGTGSLTKAGVATLTLSGTNTYSGGTTLMSRSLVLGSSSAAGTGPITLAGTVLSSLEYANGVSIANPIVISGTFPRLTVFTGTATQSGVISEAGGPHSLLMFGGGTLILTGNNTYTGGTNISMGTLQVSSDVNLGDPAGAITFSGGHSILKFGAEFSPNPARAIVVNNTPGLLAAINTNGFDITLGQGISGSGSLTKTGTGVLTLNSIGTLSGALDVNQGVLRLGVDNPLSPSLVTVNGGGFGTLDLNNHNFSVGRLLGRGDITLGSGTLTVNGPSTWEGVISGTGSVVIADTFVISNANTYTGTTTISAGKVALSGSGSIANSNVVVAAGAFDISAITSGATIRLLSGSPSSSVILGNKTLTITNNTNLFNSSSYDGDITGSGNVIISAGTQYFGGAKSYTGTTTIASGATLGMTSGPQSIAFSSSMVVNGTLHLNGIGAVVKTLSGSGSVTGGSGLTITNGSSTFSGAIGSDDVPIGLTIAGGMQALSGPILVSTATTNPGATLAISGAGFLRPANSNFVNNGTFDISAATSGISVQFLSGSGSVVLGNNTLTLANFAGTGFTSTFSGVISGTGGVIVVGGTGGSGANRILTGKNTYSGATTVQSGGILQLNSGGGLGNSAVANAGTLQLGASSSVLSLSGTGLVNLGSSNLTLNNAGDTFSGTITGVGGSLTIVAGSETLAGASSYTGGTIVNGGKLNVTGSIGSSAVTVASGATLGGTGTVGATAVQNGGTLAPGNSIGTLTVNGNLTLTPGSAYSVEVSPTTADRTMVSGAASINGTVITSVAAGTYVPGQRYTLITATSGVSGTFASLTGIPASLKGQLSYDASNAYLTLSPNTLAPLISNVTPNQQKLVSAIDVAVTSGIVPGAGFQALYGLSGPALNSALDQISGQVGANTVNAVGQASLSFLTMTAQGGSGGGNFAPGSAFGGADAPHRAQLGAGETRVWASAYGGHVGLAADAASGAASLSASNVGLIGGVDMAWDGELLAGVTVGLGRQNFSSGNGTGNSDDIMIGVYARKDFGPLYVTTAFGYGSHHIESLRVITVSGTDVLQGKQHADDYGGRVEAGWRMALDDQYQLSPYFAVAAQSFESAAYMESALSGASTFALSVAARSSTLGRTELGSGISRDYETENGVLTADLRAAWAHQLDDAPLTQASFQTLPGASFLVAGVRPASDTALLGAGIQVQNRSGLFFGFKGETQLGDGTTILQGMGNLGWRW